MMIRVPTWITRAGFSPEAYQRLLDTLLGSKKSPEVLALAQKNEAIGFSSEAALRQARALMHRKERLLLKQGIVPHA